MWRIVGRSWRIAAGNLGVVCVVALVQLCLGLAALALPGQDEVWTAGQQLLGVVLGLVNFFFLPFVQGGYLAVANAKASQRTEPSALTEFWQGARQWYGRLLGFEALTVVLVLALVVGSGLLLVLALLPAQRAMTLSVVLTLAASVPIGIGLYVFLLIVTMTPIAIVVENLKVFQGLARGLRIGRRMVGQLVLMNLACLLTVLPGLMLVGIFGLLGWPLVTVLLQSFLSAVLMLVFLLAYVQLYQSQGTS